jgi:hypothetical protein
MAEEKEADVIWIWMDEWGDSDGKLHLWAWEEVDMGVHEREQQRAAEGRASYAGGIIGSTHDP